MEHENETKLGSRHLLLGLFLALASSAALAQPSLSAVTNGVNVKLEQQLVARGDGKPVSKPEQAAQQTRPGDVLEYTATYSNQGAAAVKNLAGVLPVPQGLSYLPNTAKPAGLEASLDGKTFARVPLKRQVKLADGRVQEQEVPVSEYRSLRWELGSLAPGKSVSVSARMQLNPIGATGAAAAVPAR